MPHVPAEIWGVPTEVWGVLIGLVVVGVIALTRYWITRKSSLLAAVVGFTSLAAAILGGVLSLAGVPQAIFTGTGVDLSNADAVWKVTQSVTLTFGALAVVAASVITYHRQRSQQQQVEAAQKQVATAQQQLEHDRDKFHAEQTREAERSRQERYAKGAQMLADDSPAVRIAGLNVITALGREVSADNELRQLCVNLICAYLRATSPATPTPSSEPDQSPAPTDDYQVVAAEACRLLPTLLEQATNDAAKPAAHPLILDLRAVNLIDLNLSRRTVDTASFDGAQFTGTAWFDGAQFTDTASFGQATFTGGAFFNETRFIEDASFEGAQFTGTASFDGAQFTGTATFDGAQFTGTARFDGAQFTGTAWFDGAQFTGTARFDGAQFTGTARFDGATFTGTAWFCNATFTGPAWFLGATFTGTRPLHPSRAAALRWFDGANLSVGAAFEGATFTGDASFDGAQFTECSGPDHPHLAGAVFEASERFEGAIFGPEPEPPTGGEQGAG